MGIMRFKLNNTAHKREEARIHRVATFNTNHRIVISALEERAEQNNSAEGNAAKQSKPRNSRLLDKDGRNFGMNITDLCFASLPIQN